MLEVQGLRVRYGAGAPALDGVDLRIADGECVALLGANGAGKSTLFRALSGLLRSEGVVSFAGRDLRVMRPASIVTHGVAQCPEGRRLFGELSVEKNLLLGAYTAHRNKAATAQALDEVLELFPALREKLRVPARVLSGGQQQMVAIGRALMARPKLLLLDEPTLGLAPQVVSAVMAAIARINSAGTMVLVAEQNANAALEVVQRGYVLAGGRVVLEGPSASLRQNEMVKKAFIGA